MLESDERLLRSPADAAEGGRCEEIALSPEFFNARADGEVCVQDLVHEGEDGSPPSRLCVCNDELISEGLFQAIEHAQEDPFLGRLRPFPIVEEHSHRGVHQSDEALAQSS